MEKYLLSYDDLNCLPYEEKNEFDYKEVANMPLEISCFLQLVVLNNVSYPFWLLHLLTVLSVCDGNILICTYRIS